jgi:RecG-like helicase
VYDVIRAELDGGGRVYIVCPLVKESDGKRDEAEGTVRRGGRAGGLWGGEGVECRA